MQTKKDYTEIIVESYIPKSTAGLHGAIHIRPLDGQYPFLPTMQVSCSDELKTDYAVGTRFRVQATLNQRLGGTLYVYTSYRRKYKVLK